MKLSVFTITSIFLSLNFGMMYAARIRENYEPRTHDTNFNALNIVNRNVLAILAGQTQTHNLLVDVLRTLGQNNLPTIRRRKFRLKIDPILCRRLKKS